MQKKFRYSLIGGGLIFIAALGSLFPLLAPVRAGNSSNAFANELTNTKPTTNIVSEAQLVTQEFSTTANLETSINISTSKSEDDYPALPTEADPETDISKILEQTRMLVEKNEANLFGKPGWLYEKHEHYWPLRYASNTGEIYGIPVTELFGSDTVTREEWYEIDEQGYFRQKVGQTTDAGSVIRTQWAVTGGQFISLELVGVTEQAIHPADSVNKPPLGSDFPAYLEMVQSEKQTNITAWYDTDQYVVVITTVKDEPEMNSAGESIQSTQIKYQFNLETGAIQLFEVSDQTTNGEWIIRERSLLLEQNIVENLPLNATQILQEASVLIYDLSQPTND